MNLPQGPHSGSQVYLCGHSGGGNSKVMRNKAREMSRGRVVDGFVCPARECELSPTITLLELHLAFIEHSLHASFSSSCYIILILLIAQQP